MIRQNIGIINAMIRITCGLVILSYSTAKMIRHPSQMVSTMILASLAAMKVAEGIVKYCPLTDVLTKYIDFDDEDENTGVTQKVEYDGPEEPINPS